MEASNPAFSVAALAQQQNCTDPVLGNSFAVEELHAELRAAQLLTSIAARLKGVYSGRKILSTKILGSPQWLAGLRHAKCTRRFQQLDGFVVVNLPRSAREIFDRQIGAGMVIPFSAGLLQKPERAR